MMPWTCLRAGCHETRARSRYRRPLGVGAAVVKQASIFMGAAQQVRRGHSSRRRSGGGAGSGSYLGGLAPGGGPNRGWLAGTHVGRSA